MREHFKHFERALQTFLYVFVDVIGKLDACKVEGKEKLLRCNQAMFLLRASLRNRCSLLCPPRVMCNVFSFVFTQNNAKFKAAHLR